MAATGDPPSRAPRPPETLDDHYRQTEYRVALENFELTFRIGARHPEADTLLRDEFGPVHAWAIITPFNPGSVPLCEIENLIRLAELRRTLDERGNQWLPGTNHDPANHWPDEIAVMILDISRTQAEDLGRLFG